ncbi:MAG: hypothetical protein ACREPE_15385 [Lysobacter sp.]
MSNRWSYKVVELKVKLFAGSMTERSKAGKLPGATVANQKEH